MFFGTTIIAIKPAVAFGPLCRNHSAALSASQKPDKREVTFCFVLRTPNRRLLAKNVIFDFVRPFALIPKYAGNCERSRDTDAASEQPNSSQNPSSFVWSELLSKAWTFLEQNPRRLPRFAWQKPKWNARAGWEEKGVWRKWIPTPPSLSPPNFVFRFAKSAAN